MPRTTTVETPGCPPLRALTFDALGLVKGKVEEYQELLVSVYLEAFFFVLAF